MDPVQDPDAAVFQTDRAMAALEKYAAVTNLTVRLYGRDERMITAPTGSNPLFELFTKGREPRILDECVRRCLAQTDASAIVVEDGHGLAVVGTPFANDGAVVAAAVAGYVLTGHLDQREMQRLARDSGLAFESVWGVVRQGLPVPRQRLPLYGELLRIIGDTLLSEYARSRQLEETLARLEAADRSKDEFLATLSHELRTPLNAILGWARMLRGRILDEAMSARALEAIERNAHGQTRLINDLLDVSRIVAGKLDLELQRVDLVPLIEVVLDAVRVGAEAKDIRLQAVLDPSVGSVSADPDRLRQIFSNLLSNAVKFTPPGGRITVRVDRAGSEATITVSDTGQGISPLFLSQIFERFRQADRATTRRHGGLGLGLAIVRHLVELHGGAVSAESRGDAQGSTFTVTLPLLVDLPFEAIGDPVDPSHPSPAALHGARILVVDDDEDTLELLRTVLEQRGAQVTAVASADDALATLDEFRPEILVCDVGLPGTDGYTLLRNIRARGAQHGGRVPAVALTGYVSLGDRERALAAGYQAHLAKPVLPDVLIDAIATALTSQT
jgi:signal transduction histidine kinase/ActR/RegA family two-component response regulator